MADSVDPVLAGTSGHYKTTSFTTSDGHDRTAVEDSSNSRQDETRVNLPETHPVGQAQTGVNLSETHPVKHVETHVNLPEEILDHQAHPTEDNLPETQPFNQEDQRLSASVRPSDLSQPQAWTSMENLRRSSMNHVDKNSRDHEGRDNPNHTHRDFTENALEKSLDPPHTDSLSHASHSALNNVSKSLSSNAKDSLELNRKYSVKEANNDFGIHENNDGNPSSEWSNERRNPEDGKVVIAPPTWLGTELRSLWYLAVIVIAPIVFLPIFMCVSEQYQRQARCGYVIAVMAVYWTTECLPIPVTSLLPVVLLPTMGVLSARATSAVYFNDTSMLFVGGLLVAITIEVWDVHKRIALLVLKLVGAEPRCILLGITLVTWFLSMWISNTATTAMMMTIVHALLEQFEGINDLQGTDQKGNMVDHNSQTQQQEKEPDPKQAKKRKQAEEQFSRMGKALCLTVAYAANIGGIASLTGTGPNLVFFAAAQKVYERVGLHSPVSFSTWMVYGLPLSLLLILIMWLWMVVTYLRCRGGCNCCFCPGSNNSNQQIERVNNMIKAEYKKLGPVTYAQWTVLVTFAILILTWITRDLGGEGGWGSWFPAGYTSDSTPSLLFGVLMFVLPSSFPAIFLNRCGKSVSYKAITPLLSWKQVHEKMPWSLYLLLGGGYALAQAATDSGLSVWLGDQLLVFRNLNHWLILLIVCYIITFATEVTSNTAIATLMMPILSQMAISLQLNPLFLMFPAAITTSFAFMLPVATPPNAIVFSHGLVRVIDMVLSGLFLNLISVPVLIFATATWGNEFFHFEHIPAEFLNNVTAIATA